MLVGVTIQQKKSLVSAQQQAVLCKTSSRPATTAGGLVCLQACNPFGGAESCMTLSADSKFAQVCPGHDLKVHLVCQHTYTQALQAAECVGKLHGMPQVHVLFTAHK